MRKAAKISIIAVIVAILIPVACFGWFGYQNFSEMKKMNALETQELIPGVFAIDNDFVNLFLIKAPEGYIAVDAGANPKKTRSELKKIGISPSQVKAVLLTHTDYDHTAGLEVFPQAKIYISDAEEQMINGKTHRRLFFNNKLTQGHQRLADHQKVQLAGLDVEGILTPGHTPGSMCYKIDGKYLFVGDSMSLKHDKAELFNAFYNMDSSLQEKSFPIIAKVDGIQDLFTAHYGFSKHYSSLFTKD